MIKKMLNIRTIWLSVIFNFFSISYSFCQVQVQPWGNLEGIRISGQLFQLESNLTVIKSDSTLFYTAKERQRPHFERSGKQQIVTTNIDSTYFKESVSDLGKGKAGVNIEVTSKEEQSLKGIFFTIFLPAEITSGGSLQLNHLKPLSLDGEEMDFQKYLESPAQSIQFISKKAKYKILFTGPTKVTIRTVQTESGKRLQVFIPVEKGDMKYGQVATKQFSLEVSGIIDHSPVTFQLNTKNPGRTFIGFGGNFRLQNPKTDAEVIDYCLKNVDVRFSRVEMPWQLWQPQINGDPIAQAKSGKLNFHVQKSMEMAQRLYKMGIPVILSAWSAPAWAVVGKPKYGPSPDGVWGNPLDSTKANVIYKSIADYIVYLKENYGVEVSLFSFNESDLGINIRQTGEQHAQLIKGLGAYFASRNLKTKMLLGDNSDATTYRFIYPALNDPATHQYIGAISFHSWRGWDKEILQKWADAATELKKPLIVAEGSIDAQAWGYPQIFLESSYALNEINLYVRLLSICQPEAILQWQLTADYSLLAGGGIFGDTTKLRPTQRFWNIKQFSSTPKNLKAMTITGDKKGISVVALGDNDKGVYAIHLVNNDASRKVTVTGIPSKIKSFKLFITDKNDNMKEEKSIMVSQGKATFILQQTSFTSLFSK